MLASEDESSGEDSGESSEDDDVELLLLQNVFNRRDFGGHLNYQDIEEDEFQSLNFVVINCVKLHLTRSRDTQKQSKPNKDTAHDTLKKRKKAKTVHEKANPTTANLN